MQRSLAIDSFSNPKLFEKNSYAEMNAKLFTFLDKLEEEYSNG